VSAYRHFVDRTIVKLPRVVDFRHIIIINK